MKTSGWVVAVMLAAGGLTLQGCASTGAAQSGNTSASQWSATGPSTAIVETPSASQLVVKADTKENFEAVVAAIQKQMQPGGRWQYVSAKEKATIDGSFADMGKLYDQFGSVEKMDQAAKLRLFADQSTVNNVLTKKDGDRIVCQSQIPVGSHLPVKMCMTYAQIEAQRRTSQESLRRVNEQSNYQRKTVGGH